MLLPAAIDVQEVDEIFPPLVERPKVRRQFRSAGKFAVIILNFFFEPAQILDGFAFAGRKGFDQLLAASDICRDKPLLFAAIDHLAIGGQIGNDDQINRLTD